MFGISSPEHSQPLGPPKTINVDIYIYTHTRICSCMHVYIYIYIRLYIYIHLYIYIYIDMYVSLVHAFTYIHLCANNQFHNYTCICRERERENACKISSSGQSGMQ